MSLNWLEATSRITCLWFSVSLPPSSLIRFIPGANSIAEKCGFPEIERACLDITKSFERYLPSYCLISQKECGLSHTDVEVLGSAVPETPAIRSLEKYQSFFFAKKTVVLAVENTAFRFQEIFL